jgi:hypothetical protein
MRPTWRAGGAFGAMLLIAACGSAAAPTSTTRPSAKASSSPTPMVFASTLYPYSITLPTGWIANAATTTWDGTGAPAGDEPVVDAFENPSLAAMAFGSATPAKSPLAAWVADGIAANFLVHGDRCPQTPNSVEPVTIGGQPGKLVAWNCSETLINAAFTVANGYGFRFVFRDPNIPAATDAADRATFTTMLESVVFH